MKHPNTPLRQLWTACLALGVVPCAVAAPLTLQQTPWGMGKGPAPNIIVSLDNSSSMQAHGLAELRTALKATFSSANIADDQIRLGWQSMHHCNNIPGADTSASGVCRGYNGVRRFSGAHRAAFLDWVDSLALNNGTPSHWSVDRAGQYLSRTDLGINSPWALNPGVTEGPILACRRSYNIFMTDGEYGHAWAANGQDMSGPDGVRIVRGGNTDGTTTTLPDGKVYDTTSDQTKLYRDAWGSPTHSSLSDLAFYYWSHDLQPGIPNQLKPPPQQQRINENLGSATQAAMLEPYWNPRNNPATWQHLVQYSIGFKDAARWTGSPQWIGDTFTGLGGLIRGNVDWPSPFCSDGLGGENLPCDGGTRYQIRRDARKAELWHMALNSRGLFVPAPDAQSLVVAFKHILDEITAAGTQDIVSIAAAGGRRRENRLIHEASYDSDRWSGDVTAWAYVDSTGMRDSTPSWRAASLLDASTLTPASRKIFTHTGAAASSFEWNRLSDDQKSLLRGNDNNAVGQQRLDYLRGDRSNEKQNGGTLRDRNSRLGSIINSNLWIATAPQRLRVEHPGHASFRTQHATRPHTLYVGASDGMLHAFDGASGAERFAYVPQGVLATLAAYTQPDFKYRATVDGHAFSGDADLRRQADDTSTAATWRTLLVGGLGAGGRGYYVLDVTDPTQFAESQVLLDRTFAADSVLTIDGAQDIGHQFAAPVTDGPLTQRSEQIVQLNNGRWAVLMGNGINSANERPVLLIQYLDGDRKLLTIVASQTTGQGNGLSAPRPVDVNGDGTADIAYAGDLLGQLWKFNLTQKNDSEWGVASWDGSDTACKSASTVCQPLARVNDGAKTNPQVQPITTAPVWMAHPQGGIQILFGTGRLLQPGDNALATRQSVYAIWDPAQYPRRNTTTTSNPNGPPDNTVKSMDTWRLTGSDARAYLVAQPVGDKVSVTLSDGSTLSDSPYQTSATNAVPYHPDPAKAQRGWYVDLPSERERVLVHPQAFDGRKVIFASTAPGLPPSEESCGEAGNTDAHWLNVRDMISGQPPAGGVFTYSNHSLDTASRAQVSSAEFVLLPGASTKGVNRFNLQLPGGNGGNGATGGKPGPEGLQDKLPAPGRADWREVLP